MRLPEGRNRSALLLLAAVLGLGALIEWVVFPVYDALKAAPGLVAEKEELLKKYRRTLDRKQIQTQAMSGISKDVNQLQALLIRADNASLASLELQSIVEHAAAGSNISIAQRNLLPIRAKDASFSEMDMTLNFESSPSQLVAFLSELRRSPKMLNVRTLQIAPSQVVFEPPRRGDWNKMVRVNLTLAAFAISAVQPTVNQGRPTK
jgi:hypothetical protein